MADLTYTFVFTDPVDFAGRIVHSTKIIDVPGIIDGMIADDRQYFVDNMQAGFDGLVPTIQTYFDELIAQNNADLTAAILDQVIVIDVNNVYDINVTHAATADSATDADTVAGVTPTDIYTNVVDNLIPVATVANALRLENQSINDILANVPTIIVNQALDSDKLDGLTKEEIATLIKAQILSEQESNATTLSGQTLPEIVASIRGYIEQPSSGWIAAKADTFGDRSVQDWEDYIAGSSTATTDNALHLGGKTLSEIEAERAAQILSATDSYLMDYNASVTSKIEQTLVNNSSDSALFDGDTRLQWLTTIKETLVDNASDSVLFDGSSRLQWEDRIDVMINSNTDIMATIQSNVENTWKAHDSNTADEALLANALASSASSAIIDASVIAVGVAPRYIDASYIEGKTFQDIVDAVSVAASSDIIARGALRVHNTGSTVLDLLNIEEIAIETSTYTFGAIAERFSEIVVDSYDLVLGSKIDPVTFDPDSIDIWSRVSIEYSNGRPSKKEYYFTKDLDVTIGNGYALVAPEYGFSASAASGATITKIEYNEFNTVYAYGTGTPSESVTITWRDATTDIGSVDAGGDFMISSANAGHDRYIDSITESASEFKMVETRFTYNADGTLQKKDFYDRNATLYYTVDYSFTWAGTAFNTDIILDVNLTDIGTFTPTTTTEVVEMNGEYLKKITSSTSSVVSNIPITLIPNDAIWDNNEIYIERTLTVPDPLSVSDTIDIDYTVTNVGPNTINNIQITETEAGIITAGVIASLTTGSDDSATCTATYVVDATDVENGRLPDSILGVDAENASGDTITRANAKVMPAKTIYNIKTEVAWYSQTNRADKRVGS